MKYLLMPIFALLAPATVLAMGCAMLRIERTKVHRFPYERYELAVLAGENAERDVDALCHKIAAHWSRWNGGATAHWDDGTPLDNRLIRGCFNWEPRRRPKQPAFRGTIYISSRNLGCVGHELCHADGRNEAYCAMKYSCIGDK